LEQQHFGHHDNSLLEQHHLGNAHTVHDSHTLANNHSHHDSTLRVGSDKASELMKKADEQQKLADESKKTSQWNSKVANEFRNTHTLGADGYERTATEKMAEAEKHQAEADKLRKQAHDL
jgi:hypothetical protein